MLSEPAPKRRVHTVSSHDTTDWLHHVIQSRVKGGDLDDLQSVVANLVARGRLDRVAARAVLLIAKGELHHTDLRQLLSQNSGNCTYTGKFDFWESENFANFYKYEKIYSSNHSQIYSFYHKGLQTKVIIKIGISEHGREQIDNERRVLMKCCHPHIVRMWYSGMKNGKPFLLLEHLRGNSWQCIQSIKSCDAFSIVYFIKWILDWARGLQQLYRFGWYHGDITPSNLLVRHRKNQGVIADLGCAYPVSPKHHQHCMPPGATWAYAAPERFVGYGDQRSDMYSLALSIYSLLQGTPLITENDYSNCLAAHRRLNLEPLHWIYPVPLTVSQLIQRMACPELKERPSSWDEVVRVLYNNLHKYRSSLTIMGSQNS